MGRGENLLVGRGGGRSALREKAEPSYSFLGVTALENQSQVMREIKNANELVSVKYERWVDERSHRDQTLRIKLLFTKRDQFLLVAEHYTERFSTYPIVQHMMGEYLTPLSVFYLGEDLGEMREKLNQLRAAANANGMRAIEANAERNLNEAVSDTVMSEKVALTKQERAE